MEVEAGRGLSEGNWKRTRGVGGVMQGMRWIEKLAQLTGELGNYHWQSSPQYIVTFYGELFVPGSLGIRR